MAFEYLRESTLTNSEVWQGLNSIGSVSAKDRAIDLIKNCKHLNPDDIEMSYITLKQMSDPLTRAGVRSFENSRVVLVYNPNHNTSMSQGIPFLTFQQKGIYNTYIFADRFVTVTRDNIMKMESSILRDFLIAGSISNGIKTNYRKLSSNQFLAKIFMEIYTKLFSRIINREYSIGADKKMFNTVQYFSNRFFLERVFESADNKDNIENLCQSVYTYVDEVGIAQNKQKYDEANITKLSHLLLLINELSVRMKTLQLRTFLNAWNNFYYSPSLLAIENIEYFIFMVLTMMSGNNVINISSSDIVKNAKGIKNLKPELEKLI